MIKPDPSAQWRIANQVLVPDEQLLVSMILTLTPDELAGK